MVAVKFGVAEIVVVDTISIIHYLALARCLLLNVILLNVCYFVVTFCAFTFVCEFVICDD